MIITGLTPLNVRGFVTGFLCTPVGGCLELTNSQTSAEVTIRVARALAPVAIQLRHVKFSAGYYTELTPHTHRFVHSHNNGSISSFSGQSDDHLHEIYGRQEGPWVNMTTGAGWDTRSTGDNDTDHHHTYTFTPGSSTNTTSLNTGHGLSSPLTAGSASFLQYLDSFAVDIWQVSTSSWIDITSIIQTRSGITFASSAFRDPGTKWVNINDLITSVRVDSNNQVKFRFRYPGASTVGGQIQYRIA